MRSGPGSLAGFRFPVRLEESRDRAGYLGRVGPVRLVPSVWYIDEPRRRPAISDHGATGLIFRAVRRTANH
jgi:hypothetical protein